MNYEQPKLPLFSRTRAAIGFIFAAFLSIYRPRLSYQFIYDALQGLQRRKKHSEISKQHLPKTLHAYPQDKWHDPLYLCGTPAALEHLRDLIEVALEGGENSAEFQASDGAKFEVIIQSVTSPERLAVPYTSDIAAEGRLRAYHPARVMT